MSATLSPVPKLQFFDANGAPLVGGKLYSYTAGTTSPLATYVDSAGTTTNTNPVILDSRGEANVWLGAATYKLALYSATNVLIWTVDDITGAATDTLAVLAASGGSALVGYLPSGTGAVATTVQTKLRDIKTPADVGDPTVVIDIKPSTLLPSTQGIIVGESAYAAETIGSGSLLVGGKTGATANRLPNPSGGGTGELRAIVGGYDNQIDSATTGDGLACVIVGSHHSTIGGNSNHCLITGGSYHDISFGSYDGILSGTDNSISGTYDALGSRNSVVVGGARVNINGTNSGGLGGDNDLRGTGSFIAGANNDAGQVTRYDYGAVFGSLNIVDRDYNLVAGYGNTQSRDYGFIVGRNNEISADYSFARGRSAKCPVAYGDAFGFGIDNTRGIAQRVRYTLVRTTTDATPVSLLTVLQGAVGIDAINDTAVTCKARVRATNGTDMKVWDLDFAFVRTTVTTTLYNTSTVVGAAAGAATWAAVFSGASDCRITATGEAAKTIKWFADVEYMITPLV